MKIEPSIFISKSLTNILKETKPTEWTKKKIHSCWKQNKFIFDEILNFIAWLTEKNEIANAVAKSHTLRQNQSYDRRVSFLSTSNSSDLWHQKRETTSRQSKQQSKHQQSKHQQFQQSKQPKHQNGNQSDKQSKQQRQQNEKQRQHTEQFQKVQFQQFRMQSIEQQPSSFDEISFWAFSVSSKPSVFKASENHDRVLFNLVKMYSDETKYNDENDS